MYKTTRICKYCGSTFEPEFGRQVFCCTGCRELFHLQEKRMKRKAQSADMDIEAVREALGHKEFLSISETALYMRVSRPTVYARIRNGEIVPLRVASRTVRIPVSQLQENSSLLPQPSNGDFSVLISKKDTLKKFDISEAWLYKKLKEEGIRPRIIKGQSFLPRRDMERLFKPKPVFNPEEWINADDLIKDEGLTRKYISDFARRKGVPCRREGHTLLLAKKEWNIAHLVKGDITSNYYTVDQARARYHLSQKTFYDKVKASGVVGIRQVRTVYYPIAELDRLFKDKTPKIPVEIRMNYMRSCDALKKYHIGQKRFSDETRAAGVTKVRTEGNYVWYKKSELDALFNKINDGSN